MGATRALVRRHSCCAAERRASLHVWDCVRKYRAFALGCTCPSLDFRHFRVRHVISCLARLWYRCALGWHGARTALKKFRPLVQTSWGASYRGGVHLGALTLFLFFWRPCGQATIFRSHRAVVSSARFASTSQRE